MTKNSVKNLEEQVRQILLQVQKKGDVALSFFIKKFDGLNLSSQQFEISQAEMRKAFYRISSETREALEYAAKRIQFFHQQEFKNIKKVWSADYEGISIGQRALPLESAGVYVPGGRYPYPSTVLMTTLPAKVAGVKNIVMVTPPKNLKDEILAAAYIAGVDRCFQVGGPSAIAALALGTRTIPKVNKIVGPGNQFVTEAKRQVFGRVGIDGLAGPSEVVVWADSSADENCILTNLLAQAEHDPQSTSVFFSQDKNLLQSVKKNTPPEFLLQMNFVYLKSEMEIVQQINEIAPEHLYLALKNYNSAFAKIKNAGAIFLGQNTPVPLGDYSAGPSHVLPTGKSAQFNSGLSVKDFLKWSSTIEVKTKNSVKAFHSAIQIAEVEGLKHHCSALKAALEKIL